MSSSRVVRGTKGRIIFCVCAIFIVVAIVACYNNTLSQLEEVRKTSDQCHQQQENLSTQLQVIFDYKQRLEKSLKTEKAEHQQTKKILEAKIEEEHAKSEKASNEANLKLSSLQQHYNLLKTQHDDFKEECSKTQQQQSDEINILQAKLKEVQGQLKQSITDKENSFEHLKSQFMQLQVEKENLEQQIRDRQDKGVQTDSEINHLTKVKHELQRELDALKAKCSIPIKPDELPLGPQSQISPPVNGSNEVNVNLKHQPVDYKQELVNVADLPSNVEDGQQVANVQLMPPKTEKPIVNNDANVLPIPVAANVLPSNQKTSTTANTSLAGAHPLHSPVVTISNNIPSEKNAEIQKQNVLLPPQVVKAFPREVVPEPENNFEANDGAKNLNDVVLNHYFPHEVADVIAKKTKEEKQNKIKEHSLREDAGENAAVEVEGPGPVDIAHDQADGGGMDDPEAEDDDPDYADPIARQKDIAIRN